MVPLALADQFRELGEIELDRLDDARLLGHLVAARGALALEQATLALHIFVFRLEPWVVGRVSDKVPASEIELVVGDVFDSVIGQSFSEERTPWKGDSEASLRAWMKTLIARRIADHYRKPRPRLELLPEEHQGDEGLWGPDAGQEPDHSAAVAVMDAFDRCLAELSDVHAEVVRVAVLDGHPSKEVAERINADDHKLDRPMSDANVDKITSRFRKKLRAMLADGDD